MQWICRQWMGELTISFSTNDSIKWVQSSVLIRTSHWWRAFAWSSWPFNISRCIGSSFFLYVQDKNDASVLIKDQVIHCLDSPFHLVSPFVSVTVPPSITSWFFPYFVGSSLPAFKPSALLLNYKLRLFWSFVEPWLPPFGFCSTEHLLYGILGIHTLSHPFQTHSSKDFSLTIHRNLFMEVPKIPTIAESNINQISV